VVAYFVNEYARGRTPNPCLRCNAAIKFGRLLEHLAAAGVSRLATGHYARLQREADGSVALYRGVDPGKDQSYFLSRLPLEILPRLSFPLGSLTKGEVRRRYQDLGLPLLGADQESMEICFIPDGRYPEFIRRQRGAPGPPGDMVDSRGQLLGRHRGLEAYTVGQRRGLGVPAREPYYVVALQPEGNRVVLGYRSELLAAGLLASQVNWLIAPPQRELEASAVIRYRHPGVAARIMPLEGGQVRVIFATPQAAVAPGQGVVFYRGDRVLGGAWIEAALK
jgi:tRNA-specific 2-thiouridylase